MLNQKLIFSEYESDAWFLRNKDSNDKSQKFIDIDETLAYIRDGQKNLEIGCSNGI